MEALQKIRAESITAVSSAASLDDIEKLRVAYLGKSGVIAEKMKLLASLPVEEKKSFGAEVNKLKSEISELIESKKTSLETTALNARLSHEKIDVTLPPRGKQNGSIHPISQVMDEAIAILGNMGFQVAEGPEIEDDFHNFTALNIPDNHPARQMHDTFYFDGGKLLRTHTSSVQIRFMESNKPPFKIISPGRTYRSDSDITHSPMFHQIEGLYIDKNVNMGHLKGCLSEFMRLFFGVDVPVRFRPSFFPFTEPSAEMDIGCSRENGELKIGAGKDWLEILGCGMVHPNVLKSVGVDPKEFQGFAFGMGIERLAMLKYGMPDLRAFFESDVRWLENYSFAALDVPNLEKGI